VTRFVTSKLKFTVTEKIIVASEYRHENRKSQFRTFELHGREQNRGSIPPV
jgi:hypothetical protein